MPILGGVKFPNELLESQGKGRLVVFAGAGVSMPSPSDLPDFKTLAERISYAAGNILKRAEGEEIDAFLGKLKRRGIEVHSIAKDLFKNIDSKPNLFHEKILKLFPSVRDVRIITTNFDPHFTTVASKLFETVEVSAAPAFPNGREFHGIAYLHGCFDQDSTSLILTDEDFGRAYISERWVTDFLLDVFSNYTVLFIGYSHQDLIMRYLRRGLRSQEQHYALTIEGQEHEWNSLNIMPISYKEGSGSDRHENLVNALGGWVERINMKHLDHDARIKEILEGSPPLSIEEDDYLFNVLKDKTTARFFFKYAEGDAWLNWAEEKGLFEPLLGPSQYWDEIGRLIAYWFAEKYACMNPKQAVAFLARNKNLPGTLLWQSICHSLSAQEVAPESLRIWVPILLQSIPPEPFKSDFLEYLLMRCNFPEGKLPAILLFEHLSRPELSLKRGFNSLEPTKDTFLAEVGSDRKKHWLGEAWNSILKPNLSAFSQTLESILEGHLRRAHSLHLSFNQGNEYVDPFSIYRISIAPHEQDQPHQHSIDIVIDATRDLIEYLLDNDPTHAHETIEFWANSDVPLLKRIAIHAMTRRNDIASDTKIEWILKRKWVFQVGLKTEVFHLLRVAYPQSTEPIRLELLEIAKSGRRIKGKDSEESKYGGYEAYNLLVWLRDSLPECSLTAKFLQELQKKYPNFRKREHPDLDISFEVGWSGPRSPKSVEQLLAEQPATSLTFLLKYQGSDFRGPDRSGLLATVKKAVVEDFEWGWNLAVALENRQQWDADLWPRMFQAWQEQTLSATQLRRILIFLNSNLDELAAFANEIADLLVHFIRDEKNLWDLQLLELTESLAERAWNYSSNVVSYEEVFEEGGYVTTAINHIGGKLAIFWISALMVTKEMEGDRWEGVSEKYIKILERIIYEKPFSAQMGQVILASRIHLLVWLNPDWTIENILPLLDWNIDAERAQRAWDGFLFWGRWSEQLLPHLLPLYILSFSKLSTDLSQTRRKFCGHLASIAVHSSRNPMDDGWLNNFIVTAMPEDRANWASSISSQLSKLDAQQSKEVWYRWLARYWNNRINSVPSRLDPKEVCEMVEWVLHLGSVFPEVVANICASPPPALQDTYIYRKISEKDFADKYPEPFAGLLCHLLKYTNEPFYEFKEVRDLIVRVSSCEAAQKKLSQVCNEMARLGYQDVQALKNLLHD